MAANLTQILNFKANFHLQIPCSFMVESSTVLPIVINKFKPKYAEQKLLGLH